MTNPYEAFNISDDEDEQFVQAKTDKVRKTHKERRELKKQAPQEQTATQNVVVNTEVPAKIKQSNYQGERRRDGNRPAKGVPAGHPLDRRSGTGRPNRPRKEGGGYGNVGNAKDELNKEKYEKTEGEAPAPTTQPTEEVPVVPVEQVKPEEPQKPTLAEYYQSKGIDINAVGQKKVVVKGEVNAEWLKKEKLTLVETKEDKRKQESVKQNILQHNNTKVEMNLGDSGLLGFGTKPAPKHKEQHHHNDNKNFKGKKPSKVVIKEDDFPTL